VGKNDYTISSRRTTLRSQDDWQRKEQRRGPDYLPGILVTALNAFVAFGHPA
jgi:hypothetical protein